MSLAQHVTQEEGFDYEGHATTVARRQEEYALTKPDEDRIIVCVVECDSRGEPVPVHADIKAQPAWRHMSFDPADPPCEERHIAAYNVTNARRLAQVLTGIITCWLASGIVFGFAALKPILVAEGVYSELCSAADRKSKTPCAQQDLRLNVFFVAASIAANLACLVAGAVLDRYGRRACWIASSIFIAVGSLLMGCSFASDEFDGYLAGNILLSLGGTFVFVSSFQLANAFPRFSGIIVALITGAFDASAAIFLFYRMAYEATGGSFSVERFFFGFLAVPILILVAELTYMPPHSYHTLPELEIKIERALDQSRDVYDSDGDLSDAGDLNKRISNRAGRRMAMLGRIEELAGDVDQREERVRSKEECLETSGVWGVLHGLPAHRQMLSPWFILLLLLTVLQMLRMNFFIATLRAQYTFMLGSDLKAELINHFFDAALPIGGVFSTPLIGVLLNNLSVPTTFSILSACIFALGIFNCLPCTWAAYATVTVFVIFRPLYYSAMSDYATKVFGFATFGRIYGTLICLAGVSNLIQPALDAYIHGSLRGDPTPINASMGAGGTVAAVVLTVFVWLKSREFAEEKEDAEADLSGQRQHFLEAVPAGGYGTV